MADRSRIQWTEATWNPIGGCTRVDEGCRNCYAEVMAARFSQPGQWGEGLARMVKGADGRTDHRWTGKMLLHEAALDRPLRWRRPRLIFVNSTSDLFHESVPDDWIDQAFAVMALCPQHTFQVLTKRPERAGRYLSADWSSRARVWVETMTLPTISKAAGDAQDRLRRYTAPGFPAPLPNVWLGTSISDQASADARIPELLACPAAVRFLSAEPLLGPASLEPWLHTPPCYLYRGLRAQPNECTCATTFGPRLAWVICGGESGPGARPMHPDWARSLRDQCVAAGVPFFFKQWGEFRPPVTDDETRAVRDGKGIGGSLMLDGTFGNPRGGAVLRVGKKAAGRLLDGRTWDQMPWRTP